MAPCVSIGPNQTSWSIPGARDEKEELSSAPRRVCWENMGKHVLASHVR